MAWSRKATISVSSVTLLLLSVVCVCVWLALEEGWPSASETGNQTAAGPMLKAASDSDLRYMGRDDERHHRVFVVEHARAGERARKERPSVVTDRLGNELERDRDHSDHHSDHHHSHEHEHEHPQHEPGSHEHPHEQPAEEHHHHELDEHHAKTEAGQHSDKTEATGHQAAEGPQPRDEGERAAEMEPRTDKAAGGGRAAGAAAKLEEPPSDEQEEPSGGVCMSAGCVRAAAQILANVDNTTHPCDDFYQFACGRWIASHQIPDEKSSWSVFTRHSADLDQTLRALIERPAARAERSERSEREPAIVGQMRNMYASCMNLTDIEARGDEPLLEVLRDLGGWPVLRGGGGGGGATGLPSATSATASAASQRRQARRQTGGGADWLELLAKFRRRGFSHDMLIDLSVVVDARNSRRYVIEIDQPAFGLPDRSYYFKGLNDTTVAAYFRLMVGAAELLGAEPREARRQMAEALEFEGSLARISLGREQRRNFTRLYNRMRGEELYKLAPSINWHRFLADLLQDDELDLARDDVVVKTPNYVTKLDQLLQATEPRVVANYMIWRIVSSSMAVLSRKWRDLAHTYSSVLTGRQAQEPRWQQCLGSLSGTLNMGLSALYVKSHFDRHSKKAALDMVHYIRHEFLRILDEVDWMDEETREEARLKARNIATYIGYPDELLRDELVEEHYTGLALQPTNFYANVRHMRVWSTNYAFRRLRKPNKRGDWKKHSRAAVVNAFYSSLENSIEFPAAILQGSFFDAQRPSYMNFGAIGYVIGHEITHGFDDRGRQFDKDGNDRNWWKPRTDAKFRERAQCIIDQYSNYTVPENGMQVNGFNTQGENIADNGGIKEAFRAYRRWTKDHGREPRLPGLAYSPDQLFWISAANIWCGKFRPEILKLRVNSGVHSPARFRIIGPFSNAPEFAQSFNCPAGSPMNPHDKCTIW